MEKTIHRKVFMNLKTLALTLGLFSSVALLAHPDYITSREQYDSCFNSSTPMITMYTSPSCAPCRLMKPAFYKVADNHSDLTFHLVEINKPELKGIVEKLNIQSIPTIIFSCNGEVIARTRGGITKREIEQEIANFKNKLAGKRSETKKTSKETAQKSAPSTGKKNKKSSVAHHRSAKR